jgi:hypothetical protein
MFFNCDWINTPHAYVSESPKNPDFGLYLGRILEPYLVFGVVGKRKKLSTDYLNFAKILRFFKTELVVNDF